MTPCDINASVDNIYLLWEYPLKDREARLRLDCSLRTICFFNAGKRIFVFSNTLEARVIDHIDFNNNDVSIVRWSPASTVRDTPFEDKVSDGDSKDLGWGLFSDFFRLSCVYRWGGTYVDIDNICIREIPAMRNVLSRTYDPHSFEKVDTKLVPGELRDGPNKERYNHIPFRFRMDPLLNFEPRHRFLAELIETGLAEYEPHVRTWQMLAGEVFMRDIEAGRRTVNLALLLVYLPDGRNCYEYSDYDKCLYGGEMCDMLIKNCPGIKHVGKYRTNRREVAEAVLRDVYREFPHACFFWAQTHYHFRPGFLGLVKNKVSNWIVKIILEEVAGRRGG